MWIVQTKGVNELVSLLCHFEPGLLIVQLNRAVRKRLHNNICDRSRNVNRKTCHLQLAKDDSEIIRVGAVDLDLALK